MPVEHYENFPVASILMPAHLRPAVEAIYAFARRADDIADEGDASNAERIAALDAYEAQLDQIDAGRTPEAPLFAKLAQVLRSYQLPTRPLRDLLSAFRQDVTQQTYPSYDALLDYCRRSANPVGILMLHLYGAVTDENVRDSDAICTALQLINFWQDVAIDREKPRTYLPQEDLTTYGVTQTHLAGGIIDQAWRDLMAFEVQRARALMHSGAPLATRLKGRIGWELRLVVQGGLRILERIEKVEYDVFSRRPKLGPCDWAIMLSRALRM